MLLKLINGQLVFPLFSKSLHLKVHRISLKNVPGIQHNTVFSLEKNKCIKKFDFN